MARYFTDEHEWIDVEGDTATVGITDYAQSQLGDIVFVELPEVGTTLATVIWSSGDYFGCQFHTDLPRSAVSAALTADLGSSAWNWHPK